MKDWTDKAALAAAYGGSAERIATFLGKSVVDVSIEVDQNIVRGEN